ncbi:MAG TPA: DNA translocase FtsK [Blastocatellia bacterium]|nr:DNA translocase FtsK [Blastocatellia bacterium]
MSDAETYQKLREGLKAIRVELQELLDVLSTDETVSSNDHPSPDSVVETKSDFFDQITQGDHSPISEDLYRKVLKIITSLGYASTLVLQHRLEISFRQASSILANLERDGLVGPAHGFRPHKVLRPAYALLESLESGVERKG